MAKGADWVTGHNKLLFLAKNLFNNTIIMNENLKFFSETI